MRAAARAALGVGIAFGVAFTWWFASRPSADALVVYCAHDAVHAVPILERFTAETGIEVVPRFDSEATKSLGLVEMIDRERQRPRCDVFWNNEVLGTAWLADRGVLEPWRGTAWGRAPAPWRDAGARWVGFGGRLRVWILARDGEAAPAAVPDDASSEAWACVAIAKPLYGTTRAHVTARAALRGLESTRAWFARLQSRGVAVVDGNAAVKDLVAAATTSGVTAGWTDTDDFYAAHDAGGAVAMVPIDVVPGRTLCVPNTVAIVAGTTRPELARRFVDWLASDAVEIALANAPGRQIPLGPVPDEALPAEVVALRAHAARSVYPHEYLGIAGTVLEWLRGELLR